MEVPFAAVVKLHDGKTSGVLWDLEQVTQTAPRKYKSKALNFVLKLSRDVHTVAETNVYKIKLVLVHIFIPITYRYFECNRNNML